MITFNGKSLGDFGLCVDESKSHVVAERSYESVSIIGRSGELTYDNKKFDNVKPPFPCYFRKGHKERYPELMAFLQSEAGYKRIEMDSEREYYRMGKITDIDDPETGVYSRSGNFTLTFDCMPQRWYKSGENVIENPSALVNPSYYAAKPLIRCYGAGVLKVGDDTITISKHSNAYIDIDSERMNCYCGAINCNDYVEMTDYPELHSGTTHMSFTGTKFEVTPRWWTI